MVHPMNIPCLSHEYPMNIQQIPTDFFAPGADDARSPWRNTRATCPEHCAAAKRSQRSKDRGKNLENMETRHQD